MAFTIDSTRSYLKVEEPNLISLHRSTHPIVPVADYCQDHVYEAYICVTQEYSLWHVYVALHDKSLKSNLIFVTDPIRPDGKILEALIRDADTFLSQIGFSMEKINLNFNPPTRVVIIKDANVMREPSHKVQLNAALLAVKGLQAEKKELIKKWSGEQKTLKAELDELRNKLIATATVQPAHSTVSAETEKKISSDQRIKLDSLQKNFDILRKQAEGLRHSLADTEESLQKAREELGNTKGTLKNAREVLKAAKEETKQAREELKTSKHEIQLLNKQLKTRQAEFKQTSNELETVRQKLSDAHEANKTVRDDAASNKAKVESDHIAETNSLKAEIKRLAAEMHGNELKHSGETEALRAALEVAEESLAAEKAKNESALKQMDALERKSASSLKLLKKQVETLSAEKQLFEKAVTETTNKNADSEMEALRTALEAAEESLAAEKAKNKSALEGMDALEQNAAAELEILKEKIDSLNADKELLEKLTVELKTRARGEIERLQQLNQKQREVAIKKVKALMEELRQLAETRAIIASTTGMPLAQTAKSISPVSSPFSSPAQTNERNDSPFTSQNASFTSDPFGSQEASGSIEFLPDKSLKGIPYSISTDIVEIYRSYNTIHAAPTGKQAQNCNGFVCLINKGGKYLVYLAWMMNSSGEVMVCRPDLDDAGGESQQQIVREGIGYFERLGFFIDKFNLEHDPDKRQAQLDDLFVFRRTAMECAT